MAKVAIEAPMPDSRMIAAPAKSPTRAANRPDVTVAIGGGTVVSSMSFGNAGMKNDLTMLQQSCHAVA